MSLDPVDVLTSTWMSGFCAFQTSTIFAMFGAQTSTEDHRAGGLLLGGGRAPARAEPARAPTARIAATREIRLLICTTSLS